MGTRTVTKWTRVCDKRLVRLISYIHHTSDHRQYCHVGNTAQHCRLGSVQDSDFAVDFEDSKSTLGRILCIFGSRTCVLISARNKRQCPTVPLNQKSFRWMLGYEWMDYLLLILWDVAIEVLHSSTSTESPTHQAAGNLPQKIPKSSTTTTRSCHTTSRYLLPAFHIEKVNSNWRQKVGRTPEDKMEDLGVNTLMWGMFMTVILQAAVHLGNDYLENLRSTNNQPQRTVKQLIVRCDKEVGQGSERNPRHIRDRLATKFLEKVDFFSLTVQRSVINSKNLRYSPNQYCAWAESVEIPQAHGRREIDWFMNSSQCRALDRIDRQPMEFEWTISQDPLHYRFSPQSRTWWAEIQCEPEQFKDRIIFMSMYNDIVWEKKGNQELCIANSRTVSG